MNGCWEQEALDDIMNAFDSAEPTSARVPDRTESRVAGWDDDVGDVQGSNLSTEDGASHIASLETSEEHSLLGPKQKQRELRISESYG